MTRRTEKLNSILKEVISEVVLKDVRNPKVSSLISISRVDITRDLHYAKVYVSVIGDDLVRTETIAALETAAGFIACNASKKVTMRYFPALTFILDTTVDSQVHIDKLLHDIENERNTR